MALPCNRCDHHHPPPFCFAASCLARSAKLAASSSICCVRCSMRLRRSPRSASRACASPSTDCTPSACPCAALRGRPYASRISSAVFVPPGPLPPLLRRGGTPASMSSCLCCACAAAAAARRSASRRVASAAAASRWASPSFSVVAPSTSARSASTVAGDGAPLELVRLAGPLILSLRRPKNPLRFSAAFTASACCRREEMVFSARACALAAASAEDAEAAASAADPATAASPSKSVGARSRGAAAKTSSTCSPSSAAASARAPVAASIAMASTAGGSVKPSASESGHEPRSAMPGAPMTRSTPAEVRATTQGPCASDISSGGAARAAHCHTSPSGAAAFMSAEPLPAVPTISLAAYSRATPCVTRSTNDGTASMFSASP
mmetsp:Transcript_5978/g.17990  ORF Transcript_5978/g.17990 Transcript_5978/m.17990 type:complete len:380 (+) Transcript_5978:62-1201(+)